MKTIREKRGYKFSDGSAGKRWVRGNIMFSEGKKYTGNAGGESIACIVKTDLTTGEMTLASLDEHKRFLTPEGYHDYLHDAFLRLCKLG